MPSNEKPSSTVLIPRQLRASQTILSMMMFALTTQYEGVQAEELLTFLLHDNNLYAIKEVLQKYSSCDLHSTSFFIDKILNPCNATIVDSYPTDILVDFKEYDFCYETIGTGDQTVRLSTGAMTILRNASHFIDRNFENCLIDNFDDYFGDSKDDIPVGIIIAVVVMLLIAIGLLCYIFYKTNPQNHQEESESNEMTIHITERFSFQRMPILPGQLPFSTQLDHLETRAEKLFVVPDEFSCPTGKKIIDDPITVLTGITYDREGLRRLFHSQNNPATLPCIKTNKPINIWELNLNTDISVKKLLILFLDFRTECVLKIEQDRASGADVYQRLLADSVIEIWDEPKSKFEKLSPTIRIKRLAEKKFANLNLDVPDILQCSISAHYMDKPITITSGRTFEQKSIANHVATKLKQAKQPGNNANIQIINGQRLFKPQCPLTRHIIPGKGYENYGSNIIIKKWTSIYISTLERKAASLETTKSKLLSFFKGRRNYSQLLEQPEPQPSFNMANRLN